MSPLRKCVCRREVVVVLRHLKLLWSTAAGVGTHMHACFCSPAGAVAWPLCTAALLLLGIWPGNQYACQSQLAQPGNRYDCSNQDHWCLSATCPRGAAAHPLICTLQAMVFNGLMGLPGFGNNSSAVTCRCRHRVGSGWASLDSVWVCKVGGQPGP
jgi:hypothetical protein